MQKKQMDTLKLKNALKWMVDDLRGNFWKKQYVFCVLTSILSKLCSNKGL